MLSINTLYFILFIVYSILLILSIMLIPVGLYFAYHEIKRWNIWFEQMEEWDEED